MNKRKKGKIIFEFSTYKKLTVKELILIKALFQSDNMFSRDKLLMDVMNSLIYKREKEKKIIQKFKERSKKKYDKEKKRHSNI